MHIITKALLGLAVAGALMAPAVSNAQARGYEFTLNGTSIQTNPQAMSGPGGCNSELVNRRTGRPECPVDTIASPQTVWSSVIFRYCPINARGESSCVGGFVAVGEKCPQRPGQCRYYRIKAPYSHMESYDVNVGRIDYLGRELWIARPTDPYWNLFSRCHASQYTSNRVGAC